MNKATLFLIPTPINETDDINTLPSNTLNKIFDTKFFIVENIRTARRFLKKISYPHSIDSTWFHEIDKHKIEENLTEIINPLIQGNNMGLLSEAGVPCVADPGYNIVRFVHKHNFNVVPLVGPSSIILALMASGLNGQFFTFHGYLPVDKNELKNKLKQIELNTNIGCTQIFIETPYRTDKLFDALVSFLKNETLLCIAANLNCENEFVKTAEIGYWKKNKINLKGKTVVFLIGC